MTNRMCLPASPARRASKLGALLATAMMMTGCAYWPSAPHNGAFYTNVISPVTVLDAEAPTVRTGEACSISIFGLFAAGDSSINTAKSNVGITKIATVEERFTHYILGAYSKYCTVVSGT